MVSVADKYQGNNNFEFDLVDVQQQAVARKRLITTWMMRREQPKMAAPVTVEN